MYEKRLCGVVIPTITPMDEDGVLEPVLRRSQSGMWSTIPR